MTARPKNVRRPTGHCLVRQMASPSLADSEGCLQKLQSRGSGDFCWVCGWRQQCLLVEACVAPVYANHTTAGVDGGNISSFQFPRDMKSLTSPFLDAAGVLAKAELIVKCHPTVFITIN